MTWSYRSDLSQSIDVVRFYIGDTEAASALFQDEEIEAMLVTFPNAKLCAAEMADMQGAKYARLASSVSIDGASYNYGNLADNMKSLAQRLRAQAADQPGGLGLPFVSGISKGEMDAVRSDPDREPNRAEVGNMDNPGTILPRGNNNTDIIGG